MPLINKRLLEKTLSKNPHTISGNQRTKLKNLFKETLERIDKKKFKKEESEKVPFLQKMFELLGYEHHQNLEFEFPTLEGRSVDAVLGEQTEQGRDAEVVIEWKGINIKSFDKSKAGETPVSQMWDYIGKVGADIGIVGNFIEWRLYTLQTKQTDYHEFNLRQLAENEDKLDELIFLLCKSTLLKGDKKTCLLQDLINESEAEQEQITKNFYNDYKQRRTNLFNHLIENNEGKDKHLLLEKTQKILDRLIFVMFCEDGYLISSNTIKNTYDQARNTILPTPTKIWDFFKGLFLAIDKGNDYPKINAFNGGLFADDPELNSLIIKNEIWADLIKLADYDFESDLDVNILGHIFEQSIADIEEIKAELEGETTDKKKSKRKKDGIYYTPEYITDYIVSETIGNWLEDNEGELKNIKILDPAGGSGAFPNQVHSYLAKKTADLENQKAIEGGLESLAYQDASTIDKGILKNNIFMVDLQPESVEIAKLSLWLKTARKDQKLNNLDDNVKCGNSLIDDPELAGDGAFDWNKEFEEVMKSGGFDVVVGNPPWVFARGGNFDKQTKDYYYKNYNLANYQLNTYLLFIEKAYKLLKNGGYFGFIIPNTWLTIDSFSGLRKFILENTGEVKIINIFDKVFEDASVDTCILIFRKGQPTTVSLGEMREGKIEIIGKYEADKFKKDSFIINMEAMKHPELFEKIDKIEANSNKLEEVATVSTGIKAYQVGKGKPKQTQEIKQSRAYHSIKKETEEYKKYLEGRDVERYSLGWSGEFIKYGDWLAEPRKSVKFNKKRILVRQIPSQPPKCIQAVFTDQEFVNDINSMIIFDFKADSKFVLACLNSQLISEWFLFKFDKLQRGLFPQFKVKELKTFPIPKATQEEQAQIAGLVDEIMSLKQQKQDYLKNTFILLEAELAGQKININKKLEKFWQLDFSSFLQQLTRQKIDISHTQKRSLIQSFESDKTQIQTLQTKIEKVDGEIEEAVRGLYGV